MNRALAFFCILITLSSAINFCNALKTVKPFQQSLTSDLENLITKTDLKWVKEQNKKATYQSNQGYF